MPGANEPEPSRRQVLGCYLLAWSFTVLPLLGFYAFALAMFGVGASAVPEIVLNDALELDPLALFILAFSAPLAAIPYWLWRQRKRRP